MPSTVDAQEYGLPAHARMHNSAHVLVLLFALMQHLLCIRSLQDAACCPLPPHFWIALMYASLTTAPRVCPSLCVPLTSALALPPPLHSLQMLAGMVEELEADTVGQELLEVLLGALLGAGYDPAARR